MENLTASDNLTWEQNELDNLWNTINKSPSDPVSYWVSIASFTFAILGLISNLMSVIVLCRLSAQLSTFVYLTGLSFSDMITCISIIMTYSIDFLVQTRPSTSVTIFLRYVEIIFGALAAGSRALSLWISTAVTMDRWILICYPIYAITFCTLNRAKIISRTLFLIALFYSIPLFFEYEIIQMPSVYQMIELENISHPFIDENFDRNTMLVIKGYRDLATRRLYRWAYLFFNAIFVYAIPIVTIVCFNIQLIRALHRVTSRTKCLGQKIQMNGNNHRSHQSNTVTIMIITMVLTLLICRSPTIVLWVLWSFELTIKIFFDSSSSSFVRRFHSIANLIAIINAATNFLPFCVFGQLFRAECLNIYCCRKSSNEFLSKHRRKKHHGNKQRIKTDVLTQQTTLTRNGYLQNTFPFYSESTSSLFHSSKNIIKLTDSPSHSPVFEHQQSKNPLMTVSLINETTEL